MQWKFSANNFITTLQLTLSCSSIRCPQPLDSKRNIPILLKLNGRRCWNPWAWSWAWAWAWLRISASTAFNTSQSNKQNKEDRKSKNQNKHQNFTMQAKTLISHEHNLIFWLLWKIPRSHCWWQSCYWSWPCLVFLHDCIYVCGKTKTTFCLFYFEKLLEGQERFRSSCDITILD